MFLSALCSSVALTLAGVSLNQDPPSQEKAPQGQAQPKTPQEEAKPQRPSGGAAPSDDAFEMGSPPGLADGLMEEDMWPAATNEGWKKPCLIPWQRNFEDAMEVARAQERPILVAVNMDGEIASEHFAGVRYREPETAELMAPYVCLIASVYRHTPRDYDENGQRVECPRFGTVTCGEHIQNERQLYDTYFEGRRISPRHIVLDLEGKETYDVYYSWDTQTVFTTFVKGMEGWDPKEPEDRSLSGMLRSADVQDRVVVERTYRETPTLRRDMLLQLRDERVVDQIGVLRAAIFGADPELARLSIEALAKCESEAALDLMAEVLKTPLNEADRKLLLDQVDRLSEGSKRARTLAALHGGLGSASRHIAVPTADLAKEYEEGSARRRLVEDSARRAQESPLKPEALLEHASALLSDALTAKDQRFGELLLEDAQRTARRAEQQGAEGPHLQAVLALTADARRGRDQAQRRAVAAVEGGLLAGEGTTPAAFREGPARAQLLLLFAQARQREIRRAYRRDGKWAAEWLADVHTAYSSIADEPVLGERELVEYHDFLRWIGASPRARQVLIDGLERFGDSALLHERLRGLLLWDGGPKGLMQAYEERLAEAESGTQITWFAGYAGLVAAEHHRRRKEFPEALAAYERSHQLYLQNRERFPEGADTCNHFLALGRAGQARVLLEGGELAAATQALLECLELRPESAGTQDGLGLTPGMTTLMLLARLKDAGDMERAAKVQAWIDRLDPRLLPAPPARATPRGR